MLVYFLLCNDDIILKCLVLILVWFCAAAELYDFDDEKVKAILSCFVHHPI